MIDCAVIDGGKSKETLISIDYLKKWNLLHQTFPFESVDDYIEQKYLNNKYSAYYTSLSNHITSGYHQVGVDKESQDLLCITTPMGRYRYTLLGQGITSASDILNYLTDMETLG